MFLLSHSFIHSLCVSLFRLFPLLLFACVFIYFTLYIKYILRNKISLSAPLPDRPYLRFCSSFEGTTKSMRCRYNGGPYIHCSDVYMYILVFCCLLLCILSPREAFGPRWFHGMVIVYRIIESFSNDNIKSVDTVSKPDMDARGGTESRALNVENCHHTAKTAHATIDVRSRHRINPRPTHFVSANKSSECR